MRFVVRSGIYTCVHEHDTSFLSTISLIIRALISMKLLMGDLQLHTADDLYEGSYTQDDWHGDKVVGVTKPS